MELLKFENVNKIFRQTKGGFIYRAKTGSTHTINAVSDFQMTIKEGRSVGIVGESGSGKTTVAELAAGLQIPTSGVVKVNGIAIDKNPGKSFRRRAKIAQFIWQDAPGSLDPRMTIMKSIAEPLKIHGPLNQNEEDRRVAELLAEVGLEREIASRFPQEISGGEAQRIVIARALALNPRLLVCDEPASSLDARVKNKIIELLQHLRHQRQLSLLIITHDLPLARILVKEIIVMRQGSIVESGKMEDILNWPSHPYTKLLLQSEPLLLKKKKNEPMLTE